MPGLLWRARSNGGSWVCSLSVPTELRERVVNTKGKPLTRLERSTKTDSLALAKRRYPEVMSALKAGLADQAAVRTETAAEKANRDICLLYTSDAADE